MEDFIRIWEGKFPEEVCQETIDFFETVVANPDLKEHLIDNGKQFSNGALGRRDLSIFLENPVFEKKDLCSKYLYLLHDCFTEYIKEFPQISHLTLDNYCNLKIQRTLPMGGYHTFHHETANGPETWNRELVWMVYLNDMPDGEAETEFLYQCKRVKPTKGTVVIWPAAMTHVHRGNTVFTKPKYIATGWYYKTQTS